MSRRDMVELLFQSDIWVDGQRRVHRIDSMDIKHAQNTYRNLLGEGRPQMTLDSVLNAIMRGPEPSEAAQSAFAAEVEHLTQVCNTPEAARSWLKEQPLMAAFRERGWGKAEDDPAPVPEWTELILAIRVELGPGSSPQNAQREVEEALDRLAGHYNITVSAVRGGGDHGVRMVRREGQGARSS